MRKKFLASAVAMTMAISAVLTGCGGSASDEVVLYTNADDEAIEAMKRQIILQIMQILMQTQHRLC